ncbi:MAG: ComEC/Rec2 family competence protein [Flavobacteriales bacterium]
MRSPLVPIVLAYGSGLVLALFFEFPYSLGFLGGMLFLSGVLYHFVMGFPFRYRHLPGLFLLMGWFFAGSGAMAFEKEQKDRIEQSLHRPFRSQSVQLDLKKHLKKKGNRVRYRAVIPGRGAGVLLKLSPNPDKDAPLPGDRLLSTKAPSRLSPSKGPAEFDRKGFYKKRGIHYELELEGGAYQKLGEAIPFWDLRSLALRWREKSFRAIRGRTPLEGDELAVASALWLGRKSGLPDGLRNSYADAGGMHVLAVSGLHVGIVYIMLLGAFYPLKNSRNGRKIRSFSIILILWGYALLTGFSPSVVRAVLMFSLYTLGQSLERAPPVGNAISGSALIVLLFDPSMIRDIGFLLSYSAVIAIVTLYPRIERLWNPRWKLLRWVWSLLVVSFSAQLGVLPIVLPVFGEFPSWFGLTNPVLLPLATIALYAGVAVALSFLVPGGPAWVGHCSSFLFEGMNAWVKYVAERPGSGIRIDAFGVPEAFFLAIAIGSGILYLHRKVPLILWQFSCTVFLLVLLLIDQVRESRQRMILHAGNDPPVLALRKGERVLLCSSQEPREYRKNRLLDHWRSKGMEHIRTIRFGERGRKGSMLIVQDDKELLYWNGSSELQPEGEKQPFLTLIGPAAPSPDQSPKWLFRSENFVLLGREKTIKAWQDSLLARNENVHLHAREGAYCAPL